MKLQLAVSITRKKNDEVQSTQSDAAAPSEHLEFRKRTQDIIERMEMEFDKALLILHPAGISISAALYNQLLAAKVAMHSQNLLFFAWAFWTVGITCTLASFRTSIEANRRNLDKFDEDALTNYKDGWANCATAVLTYGSGISFVAGVSLAAIFLTQSI